MAIRQIISMFEQKNMVWLCLSVFDGKIKAVVHREGESMENKNSIETNISGEITSFGVETKLNDYIGVY